MFKVCLSDCVYQHIVSAEKLRAATERSYLYKLLIQQPVQKLTAAETLHLKEHPEELLRNPSSLYILDGISPAEALAMQRQYGVMCQSGERPDISALIDINDIHISNVKERLGRGWDSVLDSVEKLPSNALLLTDRYLFAFRHPNAGDGIANIREILNELLPLMFQGDEYHVTVIFDDMAKHSSYTFDEIATKLNRIKMQLGRAYPNYPNASDPQRLLIVALLAQGPQRLPLYRQWETDG